jgi:hypothetical protein
VLRGELDRRPEDVQFTAMDRLAQNGSRELERTWDTAVLPRPTGPPLCIVVRSGGGPVSGGDCRVREKRIVF